MIVHWPAGTNETGEVRTQYLHVIDIMPTVLAACGVPAPAGLPGVDLLDAKAVAVVIACEHQCMATRGVKKRGAETITTQCVGLWATDAQARAEVLRMLED